MDLIEKLESNGKEVINTGGITLYKEMSFTKENSIIDYKVSNKITVITNDVTAYKNTTTYNYNTKEVWEGETLRVVSGLEEDIIIKRTN